MTHLLKWIIGRQEGHEFFLDYDMPDGMYCLVIRAKDWDEAERRLNAIRRTGRIGGEIIL